MDNETRIPHSFQKVLSIIILLIFFNHIKSENHLNMLAIQKTGYTGWIWTGHN